MEPLLADAGLPQSLAGTNVFREVFNHPPLGSIVGDIVSAVVLNSVLDARTREIAILRVGWRIGSVYEWSHHVPIARRAGMSDEEIIALRADVPSESVLSDLDRCAIAVVDEVLDGVAVSKPTLEAARSLLADDHALLELIMIPGFYRTIGTVLLTTGVPLESNCEAWPPDGKPPS
jgi:alkylhydroperoxidase family enzyme